MKIQFLGTSGSGITRNRNLPSILIDDCILVDVGEGTLKTLKNLNIDVNSIKAIFLSHLHADHFIGIISFLWELALYSREDINVPKKSPPIYLPEGMKSNIEKILQLSFTPSDRVHFTVNYIELPHQMEKPLKVKFNTNMYRIMWTSTQHDPLCYAFRFNDSLGISGDSAPKQDLKPFFKGIKHLIHESTFPDKMKSTAHRLNHSTPLDVAELAQDLSLKSAFLTHLPRISLEEEQGFLEKAKEIYLNIKIAHDLDYFVL